LQKVAVTEPDLGERVVSERVAGVRPVAPGFWIGVGSRGQRDDRAGVSRFIEHLPFKARLPRRPGDRGDGRRDGPLREEFAMYDDRAGTPAAGRPCRVYETVS
jgi:predicted Zn-dependent peptidase